MDRRTQYILKKVSDAASAGLKSKLLVKRDTGDMKEKVRELMKSKTVSDQDKQRLKELESKGAFEEKPRYDTNHAVAEEIGRRTEHAIDDLIKSGAIPKADPDEYRRHSA